MGIKNHNTKREKTVMRKRLRIAVFIAVSLGIVLIVFRYFGFVSKTIYEESVSHLTEVFHQSDNMLRELTDKNLNYLHMWGENLQDISNEDEIRNYIKKAQEDAGFLDFFFLSIRCQQGKPGTLDYRKMLKRRSGREMMLLRMHQFPENLSCLFLPPLRLTELIRDLNMMP